MYYALAGNVSVVAAAVVITVGNFCCFSVFFLVSAIKARCAARPCWNVLPRCIPRCRQKGV
jgi:hypothetical protein